MAENSTGDRPWSDKEVMSHLARMFRTIDPVPEHVVAAGKAALAWRSIDDDLAALTFDSAVERELLAGVRSAAVVQRTLSYECEGRSVEIEASPELLVVQLLPAEMAEVEVRTPEGMTATTTDELGRLELRPAPTGPVSLRFRPATGGTITTEWTTF